jgi:hypothetical protein
MLIATFPASNPLAWHRTQWLSVGAWAFGILAAQMGTSGLHGKNDVDDKGTIDLTKPLDKV